MIPGFKKLDQASMWRRILAYILFALGLLTVVFFRRYTGKIIPYPFLFWLIGFIMFWVGFLLLRYAPSTKGLKIQKQLDQLINSIKIAGEKIIVDFSTCEIKEHSYVEEQNLSGTEKEILTSDIERNIQTLNVLRAVKRAERERVNQTVIVFPYYDPRTRETVKFISRVIPKDKISLSFYLDKQKQTTLYIDKTNKESYYFDLDFLRDQRFRP